MVDIIAKRIRWMREKQDNLTHIEKQDNIEWFF